VPYKKIRPLAPLKNGLRLAAARLGRRPKPSSSTRGRRLFPVVRPKPRNRGTTSKCWRALPAGATIAGVPHQSKTLLCRRFDWCRKNLARPGKVRQSSSMPAMPNMIFALQPAKLGDKSVEGDQPLCPSPMRGSVRARGLHAPFMASTGVNRQPSDLGRRSPPPCRRLIKGVPRRTTGRRRRFHPFPSNDPNSLSKLATRQEPSPRAHREPLKRLSSRVRA